LKKKYVHPDAKKKIPISDKVNGNLKSEILTVENGSGH
jgi:hypothetical protein